MKPVREVVSRDVIEDLWGAGYTIMPRRFYSLDPFEIDPKLIPHSRAYQWFHLVEDQFRIKDGSGWVAVPASRHDGWFMPAGFVGAIEVNGLGLFEKPKDEVDAEKADNVKKAEQQVADWAKKFGGFGISGGVKVGDEVCEVGNHPSLLKDAKRQFTTKNKSIETTVAIPTDMLPHMSEIFAERDRLYAVLQSADGVYQEWEVAVLDKYRYALEDDPAILKGPTFNALLLPYAIANVRKKLKQEKTDERPDGRQPADPKGGSGQGESQGEAQEGGAAAVDPAADGA